MLHELIESPIQFFDKENVKPASERLLRPNVYLASSSDYNL